MLKKKLKLCPDQKLQRISNRAIRTPFIQIYCTVVVYSLKSIYEAYQCTQKINLFKIEHYRDSIIFSVCVNAMTDNSERVCLIALPLACVCWFGVCQNVVYAKNIHMRNIKTHSDTH